jgi:hypothetical protein
MHNKIVLIVGRENLQKDGSLNTALLDYLYQQNYMILYEPIGQEIYHKINIERKYKWFPAILKKIFWRIYLLRYTILNFNLFLKSFRKNINTVEFRSKILKQFILKLGTTKEIIIISRSAGGLIATKIADELNIKHIICLGYPFRHPEKEEEPHRFMHLKNLNTPFLIIQGTNDPYGGSEIDTKYELAPTIELFFVETNHDFKTSGDDWKKAISKIHCTINPTIQQSTSSKTKFEQKNS